MSRARAYLGDAVYVEHDDGRITLTTENGYRATNTIVLEPDVLDALLSFVMIIAERTRAERDGGDV